MEDARDTKTRVGISTGCWLKLSWIAKVKIEEEWRLAKVDKYPFIWRREADGGEEPRGNVGEGDAQVLSVLGVKDLMRERVVSATDDIVGGEGGPKRVVLTERSHHLRFGMGQLFGAQVASGSIFVSVVAVVAIRAREPSGLQLGAEARGGQPDADGAAGAGVQYQDLKVGVLVGDGAREGSLRAGGLLMVGEEVANGGFDGVDV